MKEFNHQNKTTTFDIAIIVSRFNEPITQALLDGALTRLRELDFSDDQITVVHVPGAVEIPLMAQHLARKEQFKSIVTLGAIIRGETSHYDYVCDQVSQGCQQVMMEHHLPVIFGVLTTENAEQARQRVGGNHGHKGVDAINAAVEMVSLLQSLK